MTTEEKSGLSGDSHGKALTSIHDMYTLSATPEHGASEVDEFMVKEFLRILAEVALSVAARQESGK